MTARFALSFIDKAALKEYLSLRNPQKEIVDKGMNRLMARADAIGKPLSGPLKGCRELKFRAEGLRIIYRIKGGEIEIVEIVAIGKRDKDEVFCTAQKRIG